MLLKAYQNSLSVITAWSEDKLLGVIRIVGDGCSIIYIQDILVLKEYQHMGIGSRLFTEAMDKYKEVYQKVLLTDNEPTTKAFYEKMGFLTSDKYGCISFVKYNV
jgi:ribosomal protein S18 acetylase RimI-like enzyme